MALEQFALLENLTTLKSRIGIAVDDATYDADLEARVNGLSYFIHGDGENDKGIVGRYLKAKDYVELYQAPDGQDLLLDNYPINTVTSIEERYSESDDFSLMDEGTYFIHRGKWCVVKQRGWFRTGYNDYLSKMTKPIYSLKVSYNAGYSTIPYDLREAIVNIVAGEFAIDDTGGQGLKSYKINDVSITWKDKIDEKHMKVINKYKKVLS